MSVCPKCGGLQKFLGIERQGAKPELYKGTRCLMKAEGEYFYERWQCKKCGKIDKFFLYSMPPPKVKEGEEDHGPVELSV